MTSPSKQLSPRPNARAASEHLTRTRALVTPAELAEWLGVTRAFVYAHADELGAIRLGGGPRARLRFDCEAALERLNACSPGRESGEQEAAAKPAIRRRRERPGLGTNVVLLPIRGRSVPDSGAREAA